MLCPRSGKAHSALQSGTAPQLCSQSDILQLAGTVLSDRRAKGLLPPSDPLPQNAETGSSDLEGRRDHGASSKTPTGETEEVRTCSTLWGHYLAQVSPSFALHWSQDSGILKTMSRDFQTQACHCLLTTHHPVSLCLPRQGCSPTWSHWNSQSHSTNRCCIFYCVTL